jgi:hypothetical protein
VIQDGEPPNHQSSNHPIVNESSICNRSTPINHQSAITKSPMDAFYAYMPRIFVTVATRLMATM